LRLNLEAVDQEACDRHVAEIRTLIAEAAGLQPRDLTQPEGINHGS
jgi:hypothetical protein